MYCSVKNAVGKTTSNIKNSTELVKKLRKMRPPPNYKLITLDVVSLFTNIPKEVVLSAVQKRWTKSKRFTSLPKDEFIAGLKIVLEECCFQCNGVSCRQVLGSPMGSPAVLAD